MPELEPAPNRDVFITCGHTAQGIVLQPVMVVQGSEDVYAQQYQNHDWENPVQITDQFIHGFVLLHREPDLEQTEERHLVAGRRKPGHAVEYLDEQHEVQPVVNGP